MLPFNSTGFLQVVLAGVSKQVLLTFIGPSIVTAWEKGTTRICLSCHALYDCQYANDLGKKCRRAGLDTKAAGPKCQVLGRQSTLRVWVAHHAGIFRYSSRILLSLVIIEPSEFPSGSKHSLSPDMEATVSSSRTYSIFGSNQKVPHGIHEYREELEGNTPQRNKELAGRITDSDLLQGHVNKCKSSKPTATPPRDKPRCNARVNRGSADVRSGGANLDKEASASERNAHGHVRFRIYMKLRMRNGQMCRGSLKGLLETCRIP
ncbi:hypothetical protein J6590_010862 [Homalodisca vitripennis]|nr:hypothetical protein J6590_010862 [Homalodisca vitripennis]